MAVELAEIAEPKLKNRMCRISGNSYDKRKLLQEIDPNFDIYFDKQHEEHIITHKGFPFMNVKWKEFTRDTVRHIEKMVWLNKKDLINQQIEEDNAKVDKYAENKRKDMSQSFADDFRTSIIDDYYRNGE